MPQPQPPKPPTAGQTYNSGIRAYKRHLPELLALEQAARDKYDPQRIAQQQGLQDQFGKKQYQQQLDALGQLDPTGTALREQLGHNVSSDLALGTQLPPGLEKQLESQIRGSEAARGNILGNDAISAEDLFKGQAGLNLYQQRLNNAGSFLSSPTPEQQLSLVQPVAPDRSNSYVNPNAGYLGQQFGLQNYQNVLAQYQLSGGSRNPWVSSLGGALQGAQAGGSVGGGYGAAAGAIIGGVGGYFSDSRVKERVKTLYRDAIGKVKEWNYRGDPSGTRFVGRMAQEVRNKFPEHVGETPEGILTVSEQFAPVAI